MKVLFIGGTGTISSAISRLLLSRGDELYLLNRGSRSAQFSGARLIECDINDERRAGELLADMSFDVVADFIAFKPQDVSRDFRLFNGRTRQYIFISSASAYEKPPQSCFISEKTPLVNPFWEYSRNKAACEEYLFARCREDGFPLTVVRPSHTYDERKVPLGVHGAKGSWQVLSRMLEGKRVIIHGDGSSLWTLTSSEDFARAFVGILGNERALGESVQITSDESICWNQIYESIARALCVELHAAHVSSEFLAAVSDYDLTGSLIGDKANSVIFDNSKLHSLVPDFKAEIPFEQGIKRTVEYVLSHEECRVPDPEFDKWCDDVLAALDGAREQLSRKYVRR